MERLATLNLAERDPHPVEEFFLHSHPPIGRRIAYARQFPGGRSRHSIKTVPLCPAHPSKQQI